MQTCLAIKRCQRTKIGKVIDLSSTKFVKKGSAYVHHYHTIPSLWLLEYYLLSILQAVNVELYSPAKCVIKASIFPSTSLSSCQALPIRKKYIENLRNTCRKTLCPSVLCPNLASKNKCWQAPRKHKNIQTHFWST